MTWFTKFIAWVCWLFDLPPWQKRYATRVIIDDGVEPKGSRVMGKPLSNLNQRRINLSFTDEDGRDENVQQGSVTAKSSDEAVAQIFVDPGEKFAIIKPVEKGVSETPVDEAGVPTEMAFTVTADADTKGTVREISGVYTCAIVGRDATAVKITEDEDTPLP